LVIRCLPCFSIMSMLVAGDDGRLAVLAHGAVHGAGVAHGLLDHLARPAGSRLRGRRRRSHDLGRISDRNGVSRLQPRGQV